MPSPDPLAELDEIHKRLSALGQAEPRREIRDAIASAADEVLDALVMIREAAKRAAEPQPPPARSRIVRAQPPARRRR